VPACDLERREVELLDRAGIGDFRREIAEMAREINARGVVPLDIKLATSFAGLPAAAGQETGEQSGDARAAPLDGLRSRQRAAAPYSPRLVRFVAPEQAPGRQFTRSGVSPAAPSRKSRARLSNRRCS